MIRITTVGRDLRQRGDGPSIEVCDLSKDYETGVDGTVTALDDVSFEVEDGSVLGILGPNGAGKTTLIKSMLGLVVPSSGTVRIDGRPIRKHGPAMYTKMSAVLEGARNVYWRLSVRENVDYFTGLQGIDPGDVAAENAELVESFGLVDKADQPVNNLSRGMKQKTALACALARRTPVVFLDEPTLGLDVEASANLLDRLEGLIESEGRTMILSSHDMDTVERLCDRVIILKDGRTVVDDTVESLLDLFRTQQYRIGVDESVPVSDVAYLDREFRRVESEEGHGGTTLTVGLEDRDRIFDLMSALERMGLSIDSIRTVEPDFEEVFLSVIDDREPALASEDGR